MRFTFPFMSAAALAAALLVGPSDAGAARRKSLVDQAVASLENAHSFEVPAAGKLEVAFSPHEGGERLVVKVIDSAKSQLRVLAYAFTSSTVVDALIRAKHRGVDIELVADSKENTAEDRSGKARAALTALANAGVDVRLISVYLIHHDKVIIADGKTVELGSFNYSMASANSNSENVLVNWDNPQLAAVYLEHWQRNYRQSTVFVPR